MQHHRTGFPIFKRTYRPRNGPATCWLNHAFAHGDGLAGPGAVAHEHQPTRGVVALGGGGVVRALEDSSFDGESIGFPTGARGLACLAIRATTAFSKADTTALQVVKRHA
jgi:hypothetical protein